MAANALAAAVTFLIVFALLDALVMGKTLREEFVEVVQGLCAGLVLCVLATGIFMLVRVFTGWLWLYMM